MADYLETRRMNAVVCERSTYDEFDRIAQDRVSVEFAVRKLTDITAIDEDISSEDSESDMSSDHASCKDSDAGTHADEVAHDKELISVKTKKQF